MGLITKEVEVVLNNSNIKYLESKSYIIPREIDSRGRLRVPNGSKILVKVEDLSDGSHSLVKIEYDCCKKIRDIEYRTYKKWNHDGKIYCTHCNSSIFMLGKNNPNYNINKTDEERQEQRNYKEYVDFTKRVISRDKHTCQCCGKICNHDAEVHHLNGYNWCIEGRCDDTNGITLCHNCHNNFHSIYGRGYNTKEQFEEWFGKAIKLIAYNQELTPTKKFYCFEDDMIYDSVPQYARENNLCSDNIYNVCNKKLKSYNRKHYIWYDDYLALTDVEKEQYIYKMSKDSIMCITTGRCFLSQIIASKFYNINRSHISCCCQGKRNYCGKLSDGTHLKWMYYEDFLKLPQEEQNEILERNKDSSTYGSFIDYKTNNERTGEFND